MPAADSAGSLPRRHQAVGAGQESTVCTWTLRWLWCSVMYSQIRRHAWPRALINLPREACVSHSNGHVDTPHGWLSVCHHQLAGGPTAQSAAAALPFGTAAATPTPTTSPPSASAMRHAGGWMRCEGIGPVCQGRQWASSGQGIAGAAAVLPACCCAAAHRQSSTRALTAIKFHFSTHCPPTGT